MKPCAFKKLPPLNTDEEAETFLENEDLSEYDWSQAKRIHFIMRPQTEELELSAKKRRSQQKLQWNGPGLR